MTSGTSPSGPFFANNPRNGRFTRFSGGFCILRVCVAPATLPPLWAVPGPPVHEKRTPTAADAHDLKIVVKLRAVPTSKVPFPVEIAGFPDFSRPVPVYPAFLKYVVPVHFVSGKTAKSILVSAAVRLAPFNLPQIKAVTDHDDMDLYTLGERKCALYAVIPDNDTTFTFLVSLLYSQIFQTLYYCADQIHHGALPCHVHFILDEAPSVNLPGLPRELATMRSRNISCSTIIQNMAQIKELYKDSWETIPGNSDTLLYLGGNEASTHKYISEALGKSTIDTKTHGQTKGRSGSYSTNFQISGRELLTPDEVRMLDNRYCILFIRGTRPVMDEKYELMEHPAIRYTMDGGGPPYIHHGTAEPPIPGEPLFQIDFDNEKENAAA